MVRGGEKTSLPQPRSSSEKQAISSGCSLMESLHLLEGNRSPRVELLVLGVESCQAKEAQTSDWDASRAIPIRPFQACLTVRGRRGRARTCGRDYVSQLPLGGPWDSPGAELAKRWSRCTMSAKTRQTRAPVHCGSRRPAASEWPQQMMVWNTQRRLR